MFDRTVRKAGARVEKRDWRKVAHILESNEKPVTYVGYAESPTQPPRKNT
jgi:hypothetical protein